jgi:4-aminobutyrate aminotransferase-like enzyme/Ser/Thr protein kinase RdoA (MazF antagonist)
VTESTRTSTGNTDAVSIAREYFGIIGTASPLPGYEDVNTRIDTIGRGPLVLKVSSETSDVSTILLTEAALDAVQDSSFSTPHALPTIDGEPMAMLPDGSIARLHTWVEGTTYAGQGHPVEAAPSIGRTAGEMVMRLADLRSNVARSDTRWDLLYCVETINDLADHVGEPSQRAVIDTVLGRLSHIPFDDLPVQVIHGDLNTSNLLLRENTVVGIIDFGDARRTIRIAELAIACTYAMLDQDDPVSVASGVCSGYREFCEPTDVEASVLFDLILGRLATSVCVAASLPTDNPHHHDTAAPAWDLLNRIVAGDTEAISDELRGAALGERHPESDPGSLRASREVLGPSLSLSYNAPLNIVRGSGQYLYDHRARRYLDCVNNVAHVGHGESRIIDAATKQMVVLNTNTRYLHEGVIRYAQRLASTMPPHLDTVFVVNSGSEANELAIRLARAATGRRDLVCLDDGYHGNTTTLIDVSPYKFNGPGGDGLREGVHVLPSPDPYRTPLYAGPDAGENYRTDAHRALTGVAPAALIAEALPGCGGQLVPAPGVLAAAYEAVHDLGGLVIADEVQTGMGRVGSAFWAFQLHDVAPDIVTIGKPAGNGHPLAAVVTTSAIAQAFDNGVEYFNTFGGNPVSAAVGNAVLDVIHDDDLQANARVVGSAIIDGFARLAHRHEAIGDVRGAGLFIGVELVTDRTTKTPAPDLAAAIVERAKAEGVLLSIDGPHHNVIKIKPPLVFTLANAEQLVSVVDTALSACHPTDA